MTPFARMKNHCSLDHVSIMVLSLTSNFLAGTSFLTLVAISVDRYLALRLYLRYRELVTVKRVLMILASIWMINVLHAVWLSRMLSAFIFSCVFILMFLLVMVCCNLKNLENYSPPSGSDTSSSCCRARFTQYRPIQQISVQHVVHCRIVCQQLHSLVHA